MIKISRRSWDYVNFIWKELRYVLSNSLQMQKRCHISSFERTSNITIITFDIECFRSNQQTISIVCTKYAMYRSVLFKLIITRKDWVRLWMFESNYIKNLITLRFSSWSVNFENLFTRKMAREWFLNSSERLYDIVELILFFEFTMFALK